MFVVWGHEQFKIVLLLLLACLTPPGGRGGGASEILGLFWRLLVVSFRSTSVLSRTRQEQQEHQHSSSIL